MKGEKNHQSGFSRFDSQVNLWVVILSIAILVPLTAALLFILLQNFFLLSGLLLLLLGGVMMCDALLACRSRNRALSYLRTTIALVLLLMSLALLSLAVI